MKTQAKWSTTAAFFAVYLLAVAAFYGVYLTDNKYTAAGPQPVGGMLTLDENSLAEHPVVFLVRDWEIYRDKLLTPEDFIGEPPVPDEHIFIGQYSSFERSAETGPQYPPRGSATYRLNIFLPPTSRSYTLELPEIYSAYNLYINGVLMKQTGNPDPQNYRAATDISSVMLRASGRLEILIAVTDDTHFYSGMVHPPAFGETGAVAAQLGIRLILRAGSCALGLCFAVPSLFIGLRVRRKGQKDAVSALIFLYSGVCLAFTLYTCYPVLNVLLSTGPWFYAMENVAWCVMPLLTMLMQKKISGLLAKWTNAFIVVSGAVCVWTVLMPVFFERSARLMSVHSTLIGVYTWAVALYLTLCAVMSFRQGAAHSRLILGGFIVFDAALLVDRLFPVFEPIRFGQLSELAGGILVLCLGVTIVNEIAEQIRMRHAVEARAASVAKMLEVQKAYYPALLEKEQETRAARHDLRYHMRLFREMLGRGDIGSLMRYMDEYAESQSVPLRISYCGHYVTDMLLGLYSGLAEKQNTALRIHAEVPDALPIPDVDLCVLLSNLLENALEASAKLPAGAREIIVRISEKRGQFIILVENLFNGTLAKDHGKILSVKSPGREGVGIASVRAVAARYNGETEFYAEGARFFSEVYVPLCREDV